MSFDKFKAGLEYLGFAHKVDYVFYYTVYNAAGDIADIQIDVQGKTMKQVVRELTLKSTDPNLEFIDELPF
jgi:hypothetical protein